MSVDFQALRTATREAAEQAFAEVRGAHPDEHFYAFALYTDDGVMTVEPAANTEEGFRRKVGDGRETNPAQSNYYRWATAEWAYEAAGSEHFQAAYDLLNVPERYDGDGAEEAEEEDPDEAFEEDERFVAFKKQVIETMVEALSRLDSEGFFGSGGVREEVTLFVSISDSDAAQEVENDSARKLNPPAVYERFAARYTL